MFIIYVAVRLLALGPEQGKASSDHIGRSTLVNSAQIYVLYRMHIVNTLKFIITNTLYGINHVILV